MGFFSSEAAKEKSPWPEHRNARRTGRVERASEATAGLAGSERRRRRNEGVTEYADTVGSMKSAPGGSTPRPAKKMKTSEKVTASWILHKGKQPRGKR